MARLIIAIVTTLIEEAAIVVALGWGLPALGIRLPLWAIATAAVVWAAYSVFTYRLGSRALARKHIAGQTSMVSCQGVAVTTLDPEGMARIKGELWSCRAVEGVIQPGEAVEVVGQESLQLLVRRCGKT